ncbi:hypothetical protein K1719_001788 [Acacia pycnantha]|nr:hypothetical protein K1719_001788 [Acacia pycnantha]
MRDLVFLDVYKSDREEPSKLNICEDLDYVSEELRFLRWEGYPLSYMPLHCCFENLTTLEMCNSNIQQLWKGNQHFPNLKKIELAGSKHLSELPDLSQLPKIKYLILHRCVNLAKIHSSTFQPFGLGVCDCGPMQIKVGGTTKGRSSVLVIVFGYLDLHNLSFNKLTLKVFVCGNRTYSVRFKHEVIPVEEIEELRMWRQSLVSLLPFVRIVKWSEHSIEFGLDFNQSFDYCCGYQDFYKRTMRNYDEEVSRDDEEDTVDEKEESSVDEERGDTREMMNGHQVVTRSLMEGDEGDDVLMEHCYSEYVTFTRVPNNITRWSLLKELTLKSLSIYNGYRRRIKPLLEVTISFPDIILPSFYPYVDIAYGFGRRDYFGCSLASWSPYDVVSVSVRHDFKSTHDFKVWRKVRF